MVKKRFLTSVAAVATFGAGVFAAPQVGGVPPVVVPQPVPAQPVVVMPIAQPGIPANVPQVVYPQPIQPVGLPTAYPPGVYPQPVVGQPVGVPAYYPPVVYPQPSVPAIVTPNVATGINPNTGGIDTANTQINNTAFDPYRMATMNNGTMRQVDRPIFDQFGNMVGRQTGVEWYNPISQQWHGQLNNATLNGLGGVNNQTMHKAAPTGVHNQTMIYSPNPNVRPGGGAQPPLSTSNVRPGGGTQPPQTATPLRAPGVPR